MKLVKLSSGFAVNPEHVASVKVGSGSLGHVEVTMNTGEKHAISPDYEQSVWATHDRIIKELENAR